MAARLARLGISRWVVEPVRVPARTSSNAFLAVHSRAASSFNARSKDDDPPRETGTSEPQTPSTEDTATMPSLRAPHPWRIPHNGVYIRELWGGKEPREGSEKWIPGEKVDMMGTVVVEGVHPARVKDRRSTLLENPILNKGSAFTRQERLTFDLEGLLPYDVQSLEKQLKRAWDQFCTRPNNLLRYSFLISLREQNQVLFHRLLLEHLKATLPIIYTPTVGEAIQHYSQLFRRPDGIFLTYPTHKPSFEAPSRPPTPPAAGEDVGGQKLGPSPSRISPRYSDQMRKSLTHSGALTEDDIDLVVVTDSEAILGIGDQGVGGVQICIGKTTLYVLGAGVDPNRVLPVVLDIGTDNDQYLNDPLYMGWRHSRLRGKEYDDYVDSFVRAVDEFFPNAFLHFEDFGNANAQRLLDKYQNSVSCFNDDIQGTGAVTLAAIMSAMGIKKSKLKDQRVCIFGPGTAGMGIATRMRDAMVQIDGLSKEEANKRFYLIDRLGLVVKGRQMKPIHYQMAREPEEVKGWEKADPGREGFKLYDVVHNAHPTVLIGTSGQARAFGKEVITEMSKHVDRPVIFPLSNPTTLCEVDPADVMQWTDGKAIIATGSPFPPWKNPKTGKEYIVSECNNCLVYPGLGQGVILSRARRLSDEMIVAGVQALASLSPALKDPDGPLLPDVADVRKVSIAVASAVIKASIEEGAARMDKDMLPKDVNDAKAIEELVHGSMWEPLYRPLVPA